MEEVGQVRGRVADAPRVAGVRLFAAATVLIAAMIGAWVAHPSILRGAAAAWVVSDVLAPADAIVVLGGGLDVRPFAAADLYKRGLANQILVANVKLSPAEELELLPRHSELNRAVLLKLGVPQEAIIPFGENVSSTYEEARALVGWAKATGAKRVIIPTDLFSTRRVRWLMEREFGAVGVRVMVEALAPREYTAADWWRHEEGLVAFQNEVIKYLFYRVKYLVCSCG